MQRVPTLVLYGSGEQTEVPALLNRKGPEIRKYLAITIINLISNLLSKPWENIKLSGMLIVKSVTCTFPENYPTIKKPKHIFSFINITSNETSLHIPFADFS